MDPLFCKQEATANYEAKKAKNTDATYHKHSKQRNDESLKD